jgi:hypothetical protein
VRQRLWGPHRHGGETRRETTGDVDDASRRGNPRPGAPPLGMVVPMAVYLEPAPNSAAGSHDSTASMASPAQLATAAAVETLGFHSPPPIQPGQRLFCFTENHDFVLFKMKIASPNLKCRGERWGILSI